MLPNMIYPHPPGSPVIFEKVRREPELETRLIIPEAAHPYSRINTGRHPVNNPSWGGGLALNRRPGIGTNSLLPFHCGG